MDELTQKQIKQIEEVFNEGVAVDWVHSTSRNHDLLGCAHCEPDANYARIELYPDNHTNQVSNSRQSIYSTGCHELCEVMIDKHAYFCLPEELYEDERVVRMCHALSYWVERVAQRAYQQGLNESRSASNATGKAKRGR